MEAKHTPGPWEIEAGPGGAFEVFKDPNDRGRYMVLCSRGPHEARAQEYRANARLIAAAPDMLSALRRAALALAFAAESSPAMQDDYQAVNAAIAKATGSAA